MTFDEISEFLQTKMQMQQIYQPVMLMTLLKSGGRCSERDIAKTILAHDESQIEYYQSITANMVGKVLRNRGLVVRDKASKAYTLNGFHSFTPAQIATLTDLCNQKLEEFLAARGDAIFDHRRKSTGYISGTIRYEVLKRAKFRCELCGISADQKALEVDHIVPRNKGGSDDLSNFQSLCYSCNSMKRDRDDTDFRGIRESYDHRVTGCIFCDMPKDRVIDQNELAYAIRDGYPVTAHHSLIIPKRHVASYFDLGQAEVNACTSLVKATRNQIVLLDKSVEGFNVGMNSGAAAGQTVFHCHIHLIPRRKEDMDDPRGGVRHVIPAKGKY